MKKWGLTLIALVLTMSLIAACGKKTETPKDAAGGAQTTAPAKKLILGTSADYPPYEFHKSTNGKDEIIGFDIMIAKEIAKDMGAELEIKDMKFDGLLPALQSGNVDMILSGMTPTEERKKNVDFSKTYYTAKQMIVVRAEDKDKYKTMDSLAGKRIVVQKASIQETVAKEQIKDAKIKTLSKITDIVLELKNKNADAAIIELPVATSHVNRDKSIVIAEATPKVEEAGSAVAFKKGSQDKIDLVNKTIDRLLAEKKIDQFVTDASSQVESE
ncbi:amino acid ABC transporter [Paenibacillus chitinolyticus]|uniref:Amino acid ABC transporter n=1 Tax=Paenibacillus chitinolyticus TaxID=79263 RepID=A0A410X061_9BACL|nr:transporter substrate-binding domain-containing protein [Paenibacillus chitinolyticus]MCY9592836.1 transporter substrate-binding domain-containing protein [Paenibacillus chitinolyticus]MCY9595971.1 transporter substrate-binding domain-containing protein [Paenibacillus chitinolyticus]QAV19963.1 amino acid ABC transporter [Paenibacillus chitinolyticus]